MKLKTNSQPSEEEDEAEAAEILAGLSIRVGALYRDMHASKLRPSPCLVMVVATEVRYVHSASNTARIVVIYFINHLEKIEKMFVHHFRADKVWQKRFHRVNMP